jgi:protein TonB
VKAVEKIAATSEAFWRATERHALRHWRFRPATLDGRPVESRQKVTVHFRMDA